MLVRHYEEMWPECGACPNEVPEGKEMWSELPTGPAVCHIYPNEVHFKTPEGEEDYALVNGRVKILRAPVGGFVYRPVTITQVATNDRD